MTNSNQTVNATDTKSAIPSFDSHAKAILKSAIATDKIQAKHSEIVNTSFQKHVDNFAILVGRDKKACNMLRESIVNSQVVIDSVAQGLMEEKTFTEYAQSAMRALHFNVDFLPTLKNNKDYKLPWSKKVSTDTAKKAGKVEVTDMPAFFATMKKAISQARLLNQALTVGLLLDICIELDPEFKE
jgi:hypothetical protein